MINKTRLEIFVSLASGMSLSQVAQHMNLSPSTISHHLKTLEQGYPVELFSHNGGKLQLTSAGRSVLPHARRLLRQATQLEGMASSLQVGDAGGLTIACSTAAGKYVLPLLCARFCEQYPSVRVTLSRCNSAEVVTKLLAEEVDLGILSREVCGNEFVCQTLFYDKIILIVSPGHPWAFREFIEPEDLLEERWVIREPTCGTHKVMSSALAQYDIDFDDLDILMEVGNTEGIVKVVEAGYGVAFVSYLAVPYATLNRCIVQVPVKGVDLQRRITLVRQRTGSPNRTQEAFWSFVSDPENDILYEWAGGNILPVEPCMVGNFRTTSSD